MVTPLPKPGEFWWNRYGGGAYVERVEHGTVWWSKCRRDGTHAMGHLHVDKVVYFVAHRVKASPVRVQLDERAPSRFIVSFNAEQLNEIEEVYAGLASDQGLTDDVHDMAFSIVHECNQARGGVARPTQGESYRSRILRPRARGTGARR